MPGACIGLGRWVGRACWYQCSLAHMVTLECALVVWLMRDWRVAKV